MEPNMNMKMACTHVYMLSRHERRSVSRAVKPFSGKLIFEKKSAIYVSVGLIVLVRKTTWRLSAIPVHGVL